MAQFCRCLRFFLFLAFASLAFAQGTYTQIDFPSASLTEATGINAAGEIVGLYSDNTGGHGFTLQGSAYTTLDYPGAQYSYAEGINDNGQIVGLAEPVGYVYDSKTQSFTTIQFPGALYTYPVSINNAGSIAGYFQDAQLTYRGFESVGLDYHRIVPPGAIASFVTGINAAGALVGYAEINNNYSNFSLRRSTYRTITIAGVNAPFVLGTNPAGSALVGYYQGVSGTTGFVYQNGVLQSLSFPGAIVTVATGMNTKGVVVGYFLDASVVSHGFLWTPPASAPSPLIRIF